MSHPPVHDLIDRALDVTAPSHVQVEYDEKRKVLYVHVEGATLFRACRIGHFEYKEIK